MKDTFTVMKDHVSGLEFLRENAEMIEKGMFVELGAFKYRVLWQMREVVDTDEKPYRKLAAHLQGRGVTSVEESLVDLVLKPVHDPLWEAVSPGSVKYLLEEDRRKVLLEKLEDVAKGIAWMRGEKTVKTEKAAKALVERYRHAEALARQRETRGAEAPHENPPGSFAPPASPRSPAAGAQDDGAGRREHHAIAWMFVAALEELRRGRDFHPERVLVRAFREAGEPEDDARRDAALVAAVAAHGTSLPALLELPDVRAALRVHSHEGVVYFHKESFEALLAMVEALAALGAGHAPDAALATFAEEHGYRFFDLTRHVAPVPLRGTERLSTK